jgi:hypothetical protein
VLRRAPLPQHHTVAARQQRPCKGKALNRRVLYALKGMDGVEWEEWADGVVGVEWVDGVLG